MTNSGPGNNGTRSRQARLRPARRLAVGRMATIAVVFSLASLIGSCGLSAGRSGSISNSGLTVIGVVAKTGLAAGFNKTRVTEDFAAMLAGEGKAPVLRASSLRQIISGKRHDDMLRRYADRGVLAQQDLQLLMAAGLPTRFAVAVRIDEDYVTNLPARREPVLNKAGAVLVDRENRVFATQRVTTLTATVLNLRNGQKRWHQSYRVDPISTNRSTEYLGSSFTGSLAAAFANTMVNGVRVARYPDPPPLRRSVQSLLSEVARALPIR